MSSQPELLSSSRSSLFEPESDWTRKKEKNSFTLSSFSFSIGNAKKVG
jgi:hypothetical protein